MNTQKLSLLPIHQWRGVDNATYQRIHVGPLWRFPATSSAALWGLAWTGWVRSHQILREMAQ